MSSFPLNVKDLATEQIYEPGNGETRLTFTLFFLRSPGFLDRIKMYLCAYYIQKVFRANMNNIKRIIEVNGQV
jgi:hypothetical protein